MRGDYSRELEQAIELFSQAILAGEPASEPLDLDAEVLTLLRRIGRGVMGRVLEAFIERATRKVVSGGGIVHRRSKIEVVSVFGPIRLESPYVRIEGGYAKPAAALGVTHKKRSRAVEKAMTDFGAEESFGLAAKRFEEHYGWDIGRTTMLRVVESVAKETEIYVGKRLDEAREEFDEPVGKRPGKERILVELDGSEIRTGMLVPREEGGKTQVRELGKRRREEAWRDVRVGLTRGLDDLDRTYVARMDSYSTPRASMSCMKASNALRTERERIVISLRTRSASVSASARVSNARDPFMWLPTRK